MATSLAAVILLTAAVAHADDPSNWRVVQIPGATDVRAQAVNITGQVAGTYATNPGDIHHGFIRNPDGSIVTIDLPESNTIVWGINNHGQVVGGFGSVSRSGFIRNPDGSVVTINYVRSVSPTAITGINDLGQVVGGGVNDGQGVSFLRNTDGSFVVLTGPNRIFPEPMGINNSGQIVGVYFDAGTDLAHGFVMDTTGSFTTIDVPSAVYTDATGINNLGQIVGFYGFNPASNPYLVQNRGFIRDTDGTITTFDAPYLGSTQPNGIADTGMIAASFSRNPANEPPNIGLVRKCLLCP